MTNLSALGARALQTPSYPLGQQGNGKTNGLAATQPAGGTASPVSLSDNGIDLQKRAETLGGATVNLAQNLLSAFTQNLFGAAGKDATISFDSASVDAESDFGEAVQHSSGPNGSTDSAAAALTDSSHFIGKGTITTADGRTFDFEIEVQYNDQFVAGASSTNSANTQPDTLAPTDNNSDGTTPATSPAQNSTQSSNNGKLPTVQLPNIDFAGGLADLFKLIGQNLLDSIPPAGGSADNASATDNATSSPSTSTSDLPDGLSLRLLKLVDSASQSDNIYAPQHGARAKSAADSYAAAAPAPTSSTDNNSTPPPAATTDDSQSTATPAAAA